MITQETLETHLIRAINNHADAIREQAIKDAVAQFEKELRKAILSHAVELTKFYELRSNGESLTLTVRHK